MTSVLEQWSDDVAVRVLAQVEDQRLPLVPKRIEVTEDVDALGDSAWRLLLVLPAPAGETWDREDVFKVRRAAVAAFDKEAEEDDRSLPGWTVASVTTDEAGEQDIAEDDKPQKGEDPVRSR